MNKYHPSFFLRNGHINTIYTSLYRKVSSPKFQRTRIATHDNDFLDLDLLQGGNSRLAILCHGLEGSSDSKYISGTSNLLHENEFDVCAMNYRFCSGEINRTPQMYHSGWTPDLETVVRTFVEQYEKIVLVGFSLGGNLVLKYVGERGSKLNSKIKAVCSISVPLNLYSSSMQMERLENRLYTWRFLKTLNEKIKKKHDQFPSHFDLSHIEKIKTVKDFDDYYTGPLNGFKDAKDYYDQCSADQFLPSIDIPTLIVNSKDDPFLGPLCFPSPTQITNSKVNLHYTDYGGHVGFYDNGANMWEEVKVVDFLLEEVG